MESILRQQLEVASTANAVLQEQVRALTDTVKNQTEIISSLQASAKNLNATIASLEQALVDRGADLNAIKRRLNNVSKLLEKKSEKAGPRKASTADGQEGGGAAADSPSVKEWPKTNHGAKHNPHYELKTVEHDVNPGDPGFDPDLAKCIGTHDVVRYCMKPMSFIKNVYHVKAYRQGETVFAGKAPAAPIQGSCYDGSFIAGIAYLRYLKAMPVDRIVSMFQDHGFDLNKATAGKLLAGTASLFEKLHECLKDAVLKDSYLAGDETYHKVLVPKTSVNGKGSRKGYVWSLLAMTLKLMYYFYDDGSRSQDVLLDEVDGHNLSGALQSDGLEVYKKLAKKYGLMKLSCFQHCRRKFYDLAGNPDADFIIGKVSDLYHEENRHKVGKEGWTADDNLKWRQEYAPPLMKEIKDALDKIVSNEAKYPPKSEMHAAAQYMLNEWPYLENIFTSGVYALDNNSEERMQRYISMSRRSSLFFGSHKGAERGAIFYSLACSCKLQKKNFMSYLADVINKASLIRNGAKANEYRHLLPDVWQEPVVQDGEE